MKAPVIEHPPTLRFGGQAEYTDGKEAHKNSFSVRVSNICVLSMPLISTTQEMNNVYVVISLLLLAFFTPCLSQDVPSLDAKDLAGATILKTESYAGRALFGYINGGAELYLEYGFRKLGRQEVLHSNEKFVVEIYQMAGPNEAYGIFSVQRFKCVPVDSLSPNTCLSRYQLQAVAGDCYLNIVNETGSPAAQKGSVHIFRALRARIKPQNPQWPALFHEEKLRPFLPNLVVAYGPVGLQNGFPGWLPYFESFESFTLVLLPIENAESHLEIAHVRISCCGEIEEFWRLAGFDGKPAETLTSLTKEGTKMLARQIGKQVLLFATGSESFPGLAAYVELLSK